MACKIFPKNQLDENDEPLPNAEGIDLDDIEAVQRFLLENADKIDLDMLDLEPKGINKERLQDQAKSGAQDIQKTIDKALASALDIDVKAGVAPQLVYETLSNKKQEEVMDKVADDLGSVDNILYAANNYNMFPWQRVLLYNSALKKLAAEAKGLDGQARKGNIKQQTETLLALKDAGSEFARGLQAYQIIYKSPASPLAMQMAIEDGLKQDNEAIKATAKNQKAAQEVLDEMNKDYTAGDVMDNVAETLTGETDVKKEQDKIDVAKQTLKGARKGSKTNPISILNRAKKAGGMLGSAMDTLDKATKMSVLPPNLQAALNEAVKYMVEQGATSIVDVADAVNKRWNGKLAHGIEEAYNNAREELQAENIDFDSLEETARVADEAKQAAKDIIEAGAKIAAKKGLTVGEQLLKDITNLDGAKKEQSVVKQVAAAYRAKVKEILGKNKKATPKTAEQILSDKTKAKAEWDDIRKSVVEAIDNDKKLTVAEKEYLKEDFLPSYLDNTSLLTANDAKKVISAALKDFDWNINSEQSVDKAKERVKEYVGKTTIDNAVLDQVDKAFDEAVNKKRVNAIKKAIKSKEGSRAKAKVIKAVDKLATMVSHGGLDIDGVFDVLSDEFGLVSLSPAQKAELTVLSNNLYNAPNGYLKDNARHNIAAFINEIALNNWSKFFQTLEAAAVINLFTPETLFVNFIGSGWEWLDTLDKDTIRNNRAISGLTKDELAKAVAAFKTIWSGSSAYIESYTESIDKSTETGSGSKEHALNSLESRTGGRFLGITPEIWATVDGKPIDINPFNQGQKGVRRVGRLMNAGDAFFMAGINQKMAFKIRQNQLILQGIDKVTAAEQARKEVYGGDMAAARLQAARDVARAGEKPTKPNIDRRAAEILRQNIPNDVDILAEQLTMEQTFKAESPHGLIGFITKWALQAAPMVIRGVAFGHQGKGGLTFGLQNSKNKNAAAVTKSIVNTASKYVMPFTSGISFIAERTAEMLAPYAAIKYGLNYAKIKSTTDVTIGGTPIWTSPKTAAEVAAFQVRNQLLIRKAIKGTALMMIYLAAKALSDDDDDGIYGNGELEVVGKQTPKLKYKRVVVINGVAIPFKAFPDLEPMLNAYGAIEDMRRAGVELTPAQQSLIVTSSYFDTGYMEGLNRLKLLAGGDVNYMEKTVLNGLVNSFIPLAGTNRWAQRNFIDQNQKDVANMDMVDQLKYYAGLPTDDKFDVTDIHGNKVKIQYQYPNLTAMNADFKKQYDKNVTPSYKLQDKWGFVMREPRQTELFFDEDKSEMFSLDQTVQYKNIMKKMFGKISDNSENANKAQWANAPTEVGLKYSKDIETYSKDVAKLLMLVEYKKPIPKALKESVYKTSGEDAKIKPLYFYLPQETKEKIEKVVPEAKPQSGVYKIGTTEIPLK